LVIKNENTSILIGKSVFDGMEAFKNENVIIDSIVFDSHYNFYVADCKNSTVYKYTPLGKLIPFRGKWNPYSLVVDSNDYIFVADQQGPIHKISPSGEISEFLSPTKIKNKEIDLLSSHSLTIDLSDNLYLIDQKTGMITKISPAGDITPIVQLPRQGDSLTAPPLPSPSEIAVDSRGWIFAYQNGCIFIFNNQGTLKEEIKTPEELVPIKLAMDWDNNLYWTTRQGIIVGLDASDEAWHHALDHITSRHDLYRSNYSKRVEMAQEAPQQQQQEQKTAERTHHHHHHDHHAHHDHHDHNDHHDHHDHEHHHRHHNEHHTDTDSSQHQETIGTKTDT